MNDATRPPLVYKPSHKVRFVTAASLFDGHDASINIMRRILQATGCEVIHLGHNRSVEEIVNCALQEDAHGIAISSYQGGHVEFFKYMIDLLRERGGGHIKVFGGGGGVIVPAEIKELHDYGVDAHLLARGRPAARPAGHDQRDRRRVRRRPRARRCRRRSRRCARARVTSARMRSRASSPGSRTASCPRSCAPTCMPPRANAKAPTLGITGTGGAGKSSLTDELVRRFRLDQQRRAAHRDRVDRSVAAQVRRRAARRPHPHERDRASRTSTCARSRRATRAARSARRCPT